MSEDTNPKNKPYADASPFQAKPKAPPPERAVPVSAEVKGYGGGHARQDGNYGARSCIDASMQDLTPKIIGSPVEAV